MQRLSLINATVRPVFSLANLCSIKYVVVKTLLGKQPITQIKRPNTNLGNLPQVGNQWSKV